MPERAVAWRAMSSTMARRLLEYAAASKK